MSIAVILMRFTFLLQLHANHQVGLGAFEPRLRPLKELR